MNLKLFQINAVANSGVTTPEMIDFTHIGLFPKQYSSKGLIDKIEYYENYTSPSTYENLIVEKVYSYVFNGLIYTAINDTINWYNLDDTIGHSVSFTKKLLDYESIDFGVKKRTNIIGSTKMFVLGQIGLANGYDLIDSISYEIGIYIQGPITPINDKIQSLVGVKPYMTQQLADNTNAILNNV